MLAHGIRSYHRPTRLEEALSLTSQGAVPLAGGTRLLATNVSAPNVLDLSALDLTTLVVQDGDLILGAMVTLQDVIDSRLAYPATAGLLPDACRTQSVSRMLRGMATLGGESVHGDRDSEVVAALLALNAVYVVSGVEGPIETPALRFLKDPTEDLAGGAILTSILIPGTPEGAALERVAAVSSAPSLLSVATTISFSGNRCLRARVALTGLETRPARILEAEARLEGTPADAGALEQCVEQVVRRAPFRDDGHAPASYRRTIARTLTLRALNKAIDRALRHQSVLIPRLRQTSPRRAASALPYFTSGRVELVVNGETRHAQAEARTSLLELLRREGYRGVKHGCETGECGSCAVLLDGRPINSCLTLALKAHGRSVQTVEGLGTPEKLHPIQQAFVETGAVQCGYCTPAMELCAKALLDTVPDPTEHEVRDALAGCLCRCTGYVKPVAAVLQAALAKTHE